MLKFWIWLAELPGLSNQTRLALLRKFGTPEGVFYAEEEELLLTEGITRPEVTALKNHSLLAADEILARCQQEHIQLLTIQDAAYPGRLKNIYDPPCLLYVKGRLPNIDDEMTVAVVGTRACTPYGIACAEKLGYGLSAGGAVVITGLARGIDAAAARGALRAGGIPVGVVGNGLDVCYPYENRSLYEDIAALGALISEYPPGSKPEGWHFPARNRILSGLALATLVVEAPARSGALITASTAVEQGRDVFAVPGPIDAPTSIGCNQLIRDGAGLVSEAWDILEEYVARFPHKLLGEPARAVPPTPGYQARTMTPPRPVAPSLSLSRNEHGLTDDQIALLQVLREEEPVLVDDLIEQTEIPTRRVLSALTVLEMENLVKQHSGKRYTRAVTLTE